MEIIEIHVEGYLKEKTLDNLNTALKDYSSELYELLTFEKSFAHDNEYPLVAYSVHLLKKDKEENKKELMELGIQTLIFWHKELSLGDLDDVRRELAGILVNEGYVLDKKNNWIKKE